MILTHQHIDHLGPGAARRRPLRRRGGGDRAAVPYVAIYTPRPRPRTSSPATRCSATGSPRTWPRRSAAVSRSFPRLGRAGRRNARAPRRRRDRAARPAPGGALPARPLPHRHHLPRPRAQDAARRRPPAQAHLVEPADHPPARRGRAAAPGAGDLHGVAAQDPGNGPRPGPPRPRRSLHGHREPDRRALPHARPPGGEAARPDRRAARGPPTSSPRRCGATSRSPRPT